jgi:hypothetical protein
VAARSPPHHRATQRRPGTLSQAARTCRAMSSNSPGRFAVCFIGPPWRLEPLFELFTIVACARAATAVRTRVRNSCLPVSHGRRRQHGDRRELEQDGGRRRPGNCDRSVPKSAATQIEQVKPGTV